MTEIICENILTLCPLMDQVEHVAKYVSVGGVVAVIVCDCRYFDFY